MIDALHKIILITEADADGTIQLPIPEELRHGKVEVTATLVAVGDSLPVARATPDTMARRLTALRELRALGGLGGAIPDPAAWQREQRQERALPDLPMLRDA